MIIQRGRIEEHFLIYILVFGCCLVFLTPPIQSPDEDSHFKKSYLLSKFVFFPVEIDGNIGNYFPEAVINFIDKKTYMKGNVNSKQSYSDYYLDSNLPVNYSKTVFNTFSTSRVFPLVYFPQSIGMLLGRIVNCLSIGRNINRYTPANMIYWGRLFNLLFFSIVVYYAIKICPVVKIPIALLASMPMTVHLAASLSYDALLIAFSFMVFASTMHLLLAENMSNFEIKKYKYIIFFSGIVLVFVKQLYLLTTCLVFVIPTDRFRSKKRKYLEIFLFYFVVCLLYVIYNAILQKLKLIDSPYSYSSQLVKRQLFFVINNPMGFLKILVNTTIKSRDFLFVSFFGNLGWLDTNFPYSFLQIIMVSMVGFSIFDDSNNQKWNIVLISACIIVSLVFLINLSQYLFWTPFVNGGEIGSVFVSGVQGRYYIPLAPMFFAILPKIKIGERIDSFIKKSSKKFAQVLMLVMFMQNIITILLRYWV